MQITVCPPVEPRPNSHFDKAQFAARLQFPVEAHYVGANKGVNGWESNGLSYGDYGSMHTQRRTSVGAERRLSTPAFMLDEKRFRAVIIRFLEIRAGLCKRQSGTEAERMQKASVLMKQKAEACIVRMDQYALDYVTNPSDAERKRLQRQIEVYDTTIRIFREPWIVPQLARAYYFERLNSVAVAERFGFKGPHVRQILYRLARLDAQMQAGVDDMKQRNFGRLRRSRAIYIPQQQPSAETFV